MPFFTYKSRDEKGLLVTGLVEAPSPESAATLLRGKKLFVVDLSLAKQSTNSQTLLMRFKRVGFADIVNFTRQLATMVVAGLSLPESLTILSEQTVNPSFRLVLSDLERKIVGGENLGNALSQYPQYFSPIYIALVRAGEMSGNLEIVLTRLAETLETQHEFRGKISGALIYPIIILIGMVVVIMIMMTVVVPRLTDLYKDFDATLPMSTQILIAMSTFFVRFWWLMILLFVGASIGFRQFKKTPIGELAYDSFILKLPIIGELRKKVILVEFTRTLGMLIASGIHILEGLRILKDSLENVLFREAVSEAAKKVEKGYAIGDSFKQSSLFPPIVSQMMKVGEETGKLDDTLTKLSNYFQAESEHLVKGLTTAIEPLIMVFLGLGVGFIVISIITPIYSLTNQFK